MTSLDTNLILSALDPKDAQHEKAVSLLEELSWEALFISPPVYAELRAGAGWPLIQAFLDRLGIRLREDMPLPVWEPPISARQEGEPGNAWQRWRWRICSPSYTLSSCFVL